jgi:hypothetical protein
VWYPKPANLQQVHRTRLFVSDRQALRCDNAVGCKDSQLITPPVFLVAPCNAMTELALRSTNQHRPRRWLLSGGSQPRRSQLTERADSVAQAGVIIRRVLKLPQAIGRQSSQRWLRRRPPVYSKNS